MTKAPLVGITWGARPLEKILPYQLALERAGAHAVRVDARLPVREEQLAELGAILFPGGGDVNPSRYGDTLADPSVEVEDQLDELELGLARRALAQKQPVFAICRGMQMLNVAAGGTLIQDLVNAGYRRVDHRRSYHAIELQPSELSEVIGARAIEVNSRHHQAIRDLGRNLHVTARSSDGVIEGVEVPGSPIFGLQCHPEDMVEQEWSQAVFRRFVELASERSSRERAAAAG